MSKSYIAIFAVCAIVSTAVAVAGLMSVGPYTTVPELPEELPYESESMFKDMFVMGFKVRGTLASDEEPQKEDEVFDAKVFAMSWTPDGLSQKILVQGKLLGGAQAGNPGLFRYCFAVKTAGGLPLQADINKGPGEGADKGDETEYGVYYNMVGFNAMRGLDASGCWEFEHTKVADVTTNLLSLPSSVGTIEGAGIPHGSILRVTIEHWGTSWPWEEGRWEQGASDEALLVTSAGWITKDKMDLYAIGETALITVTVPYIKTVSSSSKGEGGHAFYLDAYHLGLDKFVYDKNGALIERFVITETTQSFEIPILPEHFTNGSAHNQIWFRLFNTLYPVHSVDTDVVDIRGWAPKVINVKTDKTSYEEGDTVTLTWSCVRNEETDIPIMLAKVVAWIGGKEVYRESHLGENKNGTASFTAPLAGFLNFRASCIDEAGRGSGEDGLVIIHNYLQPGFCDANPDHPSCTGDGDDKGFPLWEVLLLTAAFIGAFALVILLAVVMNAMNIPLQYTMIGAIFIFVVLALVIAFVGQGAIDAVANYQAVIR